MCKNGQGGALGFFFFFSLHGSWITHFSVLKFHSVSFTPPIESIFFHFLHISVEPFSFVYVYRVWEKLVHVASKNHRRKPGRGSHYEMQTMAADKNISMNAAVGTVLPELDGIFKLKKWHKNDTVGFFSVDNIVFALFTTGFGKNSESKL